MTERMSKWHRRGERQKETTDTYRDGWERIFAKPATSEPPRGGKQGADLIDAPVGTHTANPWAAPEGGMPTEAQLKKIMRDPAYWRDQAPAIVEKVRIGFQNLYREEG